MKKKKSQKGCIVKQHAVFSPTGQLSTFFINCILSCRVHEMKNIVHLYNDPYYIYTGMRAKRANGLVEGNSYKKKEKKRVRKGVLSNSRLYSHLLGNLVHSF